MKRAFEAVMVFTAVFIILMFPLRISYANSLSIKSIEVYFENKRPEITIEKNHDKLSAFANVTYRNSGTLDAYWEVDGRIISRVNQYLTYGNRYVFKTPDVAGLPTFDPGTHIVRFVITNPTGTGLFTPSLLYFVTADGVQGKRSILKLNAPAEKSILPYAPVNFVWDAVGDDSTYIIHFYRRGVDKPIFSACTRENSYKLSSLVMRRFFRSETKYFWRVKGSNDREETESAVREFSFRSR